MREKIFTFGTEGTVGAKERYTHGDFGFVTEKEKVGQEELGVHEQNGGFEVPCWYRGENLTEISENGDGCFVDSDALLKALEEKDGASYGKRYFPLCFKLTVPEAGNYRVKVTLRAQTDEPELLLFAGRRHLIWKGSLRAGEQLCKAFSVNVCDIIPDSTGSVYEDRTLDIALLGHKPLLQCVIVEKTDCPTVWLAGDSTMTDDGADYPYHPAACYAGWGQAFDAWQNGSIAICNQAHSGRTTETFRTEGHFDIVKKYIRPGDFFLMQFGHNDQKHSHLLAHNGYPENLARFVEEIREKGAYPVILTPIARNTWKEADGELFYNDLLGDHARACLEVAKKLDVPVLDLHGDSMADILRLGRDASKVWYHEGDWTHNNDYGAYRAAGYVASELKKLKTAYPDYLPLIEAVGEGCGDWRPEATRLLCKPERLSGRKDPNAAGGEEPSDHQMEKAAGDALEQLFSAVRLAKEEAGVS